MRLVGLIMAPWIVWAQHGQTPAEARNPAIGKPEAIAAGAKLYQTSCGACHGADGSGGRGPNLVRQLSSHPLKDEELFTTIRNGVPGTDMPPTKLSDDDTLRLGRIYAACSSRFISVFQERDADRFEKIEDFPVQKMVHSLAVDPATHRVYAPEQEEDGKPVARMVIYEAVERNQLKQ